MPHRAALALAGLALLAGGGTAGYLVGTSLAPGRIEPPSGGLVTPAPPPPPDLLSSTAPEPDPAEPSTPEPSPLGLPR